MDKIVVPKSFGEILKCTYEPGSDYYMLKALTGRRYKSLAEIYESLDIADEYTYGIYGLPEGGLGYEVFTFPLEKKSFRDVVPHKGRIGDQTSEWHHETIKEHAAIVTCNLEKAGVKPEVAALLGVMHDYGKKYTARTDKEGNLTFPDHEKLSALLCNAWFDECSFLGHNPFSALDIRIMTAVIYSHTMSFEWHQGTDRSRKIEEKFFDEMRDWFNREEEILRVYGLTNLLRVSDEGVTGRLLDEKIDRGRRIIKEVFSNEKEID